MWDLCFYGGESVDCDLWVMMPCSQSYRRKQTCNIDKANVRGNDKIWDGNIPLNVWPYMECNLQM
jgi:hypothetical protein